MIKKNLKTLIVMSIATLLPIFAGLILWDKLPDQFPIHWNGAGEIDGWCGKPFGVFGLPLILLGLHWLTVLITQSDPKKQNQSDKILQLTFWIIPTLNIALSAFTYSAAMGKNVPVGTLSSLLIGVMFIIIGNYMPKCRQNYTIGIKLPWTLNSEENWNKTHRLSGWLWVMGGIFITFAGFFNLFWPIVISIVIMTATPFIYSYILHRKGI